MKRTGNISWFLEKNRGITWLSWCCNICGETGLINATTLPRSISREHRHQ